MITNDCIFSYTERCTANNTCGGGPFPVAPTLNCNGFNPEGSDLGTLPRCAQNTYDNNNYLTLDFTCNTATCLVDGDCPLVSQPCQHCHHNVDQHPPAWANRFY